MARETRPSAQAESLCHHSFSRLSAAGDGFFEKVNNLNSLKMQDSSLRLE
jgi:hypothetical protein